MAANGISTLTYKRQRQDAKLALAAAARAAAGKPSTLDASMLPSRYGVNDNSDSARVLNSGPLLPGRPWLAGPATLYSNFDLYIIDGIRQNSTGATVRGNVFIDYQLIVTENITINGFKLMRIPPANWNSVPTASVELYPTLQVVGGGATIDGGATPKQFFEQSVVYNSTDIATRPLDTTQYDTYTMTVVGGGTTALTVGTYNINMNASTGNIGIAVMPNASFPIDQSGPIYPSPTASTFHLAMEIF
jgi:hypothetical protein